MSRRQSSSDSREARMLRVLTLASRVAGRRYVDAVDAIRHALKVGDASALARLQTASYAMSACMPCSTDMGPSDEQLAWWAVAGLADAARQQRSEAFRGEDTGHPERIAVKAARTLAALRWQAARHTQDTGLPSYDHA